MVYTAKEGCVGLRGEREVVQYYLSITGLNSVEQLSNGKLNFTVRLKELGGGGEEDIIISSYRSCLVVLLLLYFFFYLFFFYSSYLIFFCMSNDVLVNKTDINIINVLLSFTLR